MMKRIKKILDHYGEEHQIRKTIEELDELKEALEEGHNIEHILEECADVMIVKIDSPLMEKHGGY